MQLEIPSEKPDRTIEPALGEALESVRAYLLRVAQNTLPVELAGKVGASDLVQETFLEAQRRQATFRGETEAEWRGWLVAILGHRLAKFRRTFLQTDKRRVGREQRLSAEPAAPALVTRSASSPSRVAAREERRAALEEALSQLPERYARAVRWRHEERLSFAEIGARLGTSDEAARKLWGRALVRLKDALGTRYDTY